MKTHLLEFARAEAPIDRPVTKFGGLPVWLGEPQWPIGRESGQPMMFITQIALEVLGFPGAMAYLFIDDSEDADETWDPDAGANAVIVQPNGASPAVATETRTQGQSLVEYVQVEGERTRQPQGREFAVTLQEKEDVQVEGTFDFQNKIGGFPVWLQSDETPDEDWLLLLQLDSAGVPFEVNFGDAGVGYAFLSPDGRKGKFLWQCG